MAPAGFRHLQRYLDKTTRADFRREINRIVTDAPFYVPTMPKTGRPLSVRMTNAGLLGWMTDKAGGYRYQTTHPETGRPWPPIPDCLTDLWAELLPDSPPPEACLINFYAPGTKLGLHHDSEEDDQTTAVLSVSLGDDAWFRIGGLKRRDPTERLLLKSGDVVILGGAARRAYHGVDRILPGTDPEQDQPGRINLTLRRVTILGPGTA